MKAMAWVAIILFAVVGAIAWKAMEKNQRRDRIAFGSDLTYTVDDVQKLMRNPDAQVHTVITPGLFPYDLVFLICAGGFFALLSLLIAPHTALFTGSACLLLIFPFLYMAFDLTENSLLAWMLSSPPQTVTSRFICMVKIATWFKLGFFVLSVVQVLYLAGVSGYRYLHPVAERAT